MTLTAREMQQLESSFAVQGYLQLPQVVPAEPRADLREQILAKLARAAGG